MDNLRDITHRLLGGFLPTAVRNHNFFINEIPGDLTVGANREWLASVISNLIYTVVMHSSETCIRLSARRQDSVIVLELHEAGKVNSYSLACGLQQVHTLARKVGGYLNISLRESRDISISLSFPALERAA